MRVTAGLWFLCLCPCADHIGGQVKRRVDARVIVRGQLLWSWLLGFIYLESCSRAPEQLGSDSQLCM